MTLYCGIDLHANNHWLTVIDDNDQRLYERRHPNELEPTLKILEPYRAELCAIAIESTFNWYWLVDGLMAAGHTVKLVNTSAVKQYDGLKHTDDRYDAFHLARLMRLGILPTGYIYPQAERGVKDLARQRMRLVQHRTAHTVSIQSRLRCSLGIKVPSNTIQGFSQRGWPTIDDPWLALSVDSGRIAIDALNHQLELLERRLRDEVKSTREFNNLQTVTGIGPILAWTILLEVGDIRRFPKVGQFASYCRGVDSRRTSNNKKRRVPTTARTATPIWPGPFSKGPLCDPLSARGATLL